MNPYDQDWHHVQNFIHTNKRHKKYCTVILQSVVTELRRLPDSIMLCKNGTHLLTPLFAVPVAFVNFRIPFATQCTAVPSTTKTSY